MKKIVLGCAAVLLSLGLLAGCNNNPSTVDAVIISVDTSASVVVGETLELPYSVEPEKATVVAASDHEEYVTADAQDGILYLHGVTEGSAIVTLVGTYKKYAEANVNIDVSVVTEATEKTEPGTPDTGGGTGSGSGIGGALPEELEGEWLLGYTSGETNYYFNGKVESSYYGGVTTSDFDAVVVTATAVSDGATLTFEDDGVTKYIYMDESSGHHNFSWSEEPFTWKYDEVYETFVADDSEGAAYFMGNYGTTYQELRMSEYGYLTGEITSSNEQFAAHLYEVPTYATPTSITITGENTVAVYERITLTATIEPEGADPRLTWSWTSNDAGEVTVSSTGVVLGVTAGSVTVTATSVANEEVSGSIAITVTEASGEAPTTYKLGALDSANYVYKYFNGKTTGTTYLDVSTGWENAADLYITAIEDDGVENSFTMSFINSDGELKYIKWNTSTQIVLDDNPYTWVWDDTNELIVTNEDTVRFLALYSSSSIRAYTETDQYLGYDHVALFETEPAAPEIPETPELEQVTSGLTDGGTYYIGEYEDNAYHLITGSVSNNYRLETSVDFNSAVAVTATGDDTNGWVLTLSTGQCIYGYYANNYFDFGVCDPSSVPSTGTNLFFWNSAKSTLYTNTSLISSYTSSYTYAYFEWYSSAVCLWGTSNVDNETSVTHVYQLAED